MYTYVMMMDVMIKSILINLWILMKVLAVQGQKSFSFSVSKFILRFLTRITHTVSNDFQLNCKIFQISENVLFSKLILNWKCWSSSTCLFMIIKEKFFIKNCTFNVRLCADVPIHVNKWQNLMNAIGQDKEEIWFS